MASDLNRQIDTMKGIAGTLLGLRTLADQEKQSMLAYLIEMAFLEAQRIEEELTVRVNRKKIN